jgi:hypothetical protein
VSLSVSTGATFTTTGEATRAALISNVNTRIQTRELPWYYAPGATTRLILQVVALEIQEIRDACVDAYRQTYARFSTWNIAQQELDYALAPEPTTPLVQRQDRLIGSMRMLGTADLKHIKSICQSYVFGDVDVIPDFAAYTIIIQFKSSRGVPANLADLQTQVRARIPPAIDIQYWSRYTTYGQIRQSGATYGHLKALGLTYGSIKLWTPV